MPKLNLGDPYIGDAKVPALMKDLEACDEEHLDKAIRTIQISPHLAIGYNRASELYLRKGQGLLATDIYEIGLKAIGENNPTERSILQKHRAEMKLQYRDFIALLPFEIALYIFQEFDHNFLLAVCAMVSTTWLPKAIHNISSMTIHGNFNSGLIPVTAKRLLDYIDTLMLSFVWTPYLAEFFGALGERRFVGNIKRLTMQGCNFNDIPRKTVIDGLTKISQSLTSLTIDAPETISLLDILVTCPSLTTLRYKCLTSKLPTQTKIPRRDKLTTLKFEVQNESQAFPSETLQRFMSATPNVRIAYIRPVPPNMVAVVQQHWAKLQLLCLTSKVYITFDPDQFFDSFEGQVAEDAEYLGFYDDCSDMPTLYKVICQQATRVRSLDVSLGTGDQQFALTSVQFQVLEHLTIRMLDNEELTKRSALELLRGALMSKELVLWGITVYPETFEILTRMPQLECLKLLVAYFPGIDVYLDHLASQGSAAPLKSITTHDYAFDRNQRTTLATRMVTLKDITIMSNMITNGDDDSWISHFLNDLVQGKSMVERISIPMYAATRKLLPSLSNLSALQHLTVVDYFDAWIAGTYADQPYYDFSSFQSRIPHINIEVKKEDDNGGSMFCQLDNLGMIYAQSP